MSHQADVLAHCVPTYPAGALVAGGPVEEVLAKGLLVVEPRPAQLEFQERTVNNSVALLLCDMSESNKNVPFEAPFVILTIHLLLEY